MKKLVILLIIAFGFAFTGQSQDANHSGLHYAYFYSDAGDTITSNGDADRWFNTGKTTKYYYSIKVEIDSVSGSPDVDCVLQYRDFDDEAWSTLTTVTADGFTSDTTIYFTDESTGILHRQLKVLLDHQGGEMKLSSGKAIEIEYKDHE